MINGKTVSDHSWSMKKSRTLIKIKFNTIGLRGNSKSDVNETIHFFLRGYKIEANDLLK